MNIPVKQLTWQELQRWRSEGRLFQLIDVREPDEHEAYNIGGDLIPLGQVLQQSERLELEKPIVVYCKRGIRSQIAIQRLSRRLPQAELYNLQGGVWSFPPPK